MAAAVVVAVMTAASIPASTAAGYADYLQSRTVAPEQGDYYLGRDGAPTEAAGHWLTDPHELSKVGVTSTDRVAADDLRALMAGREAGRWADEAAWIRSAGADGSRAGGLDITFSAPKGVSVAWALGGPQVREAIEAVQTRAVAEAVGYLRDRVAVTVARVDGQTVPALARELHAAQFVHTTARGVGDAVPDPQLHSHVVVTSLERPDGSIGAVRSRPVFQAAREVGAVYRAHLADGMRGLGFAIEPAGEDGRYFRLPAVGEEVERAFSKRTDEVRQAAEAFRAQQGRDPQRGELRDLATHTRQAKLPATRGELDLAWRQTAERHTPPTRVAEPAPATGPQRWSDRVERELTARRAVFEERDLRTIGFEQAAGHGVPARQVLGRLAGLRESGRVVQLTEGRMTTARMRDMEAGLERRVIDLNVQAGRSISDAARERAVQEVEERIANRLSVEQRHAVEVIAGRQRVSVLVGQAGTGKGVVLDAAARAEQTAGRDTYGVAVAGRTAQQLGEASPALAGRVGTLDGFVAGARSGRIPVSERTTVYVDEAGMGDTERLAGLVEVVADRGGSLVLVGDARQLSSVGAGGMFERITQRVASAELTVVMRTDDHSEREAWRALRDGDPARAMAHYRQRGDLRFAPDRAAAVDAAARRYVDLAADHGHREVALMTDASNHEVAALNRRVQHLREQRGELGPRAVALGDGVQVRENDRVVWTRSQPVPGQQRVENGVRGEVIAADPQQGELLVRLDGSDRDVLVPAQELDAVQLGYAGHVYRQQGATVQKAVAVTGGWQTSREGAYVQASRARDGIEWHVPRDELDADTGAEVVDQLAARMRVSRAQAPSISYDIAPDSAIDAVGMDPPITPAVGVEIG